MLFRPLQLPVPSGLAPCWTPKSGTRLTSTPPALELLLELLLLDVVAGGALVAGGADTSVPASIACCCAPKVVAAWGQPTPGPLRFWSVTVAAKRRASLDALESSSGNESDTEGLLITWPAATFALSDLTNAAGD